MSNIFTIIKSLYNFVPGKPINEEEVKNALKKMRSRSATTNAKLSAEITTILKQIETTPGLIKQHAAEFADLERKAVEKLKADLIAEAKLLVVGGSIAPEQLDHLANKYKDFKRDEILSMIGASVATPKKFKWSPPAGYDAIQELGDTVMGDIGRNLAELGCSSLYDVLGVPSNAATAAIQAAIDSQYKACSGWQPSNPKKVPTNTLIGHCKSLLLDAALRARYDKTVGNLAFKPVKAAIELIAKGNTRVIDGQKLAQMLKQCVDGGMGKDEAEYKIYKEALACGVTIIESMGGNAGGVRLCRFCSSVLPDKVPICPSCSMPVNVTCPKCGHTSSDQNERFCTHNGCGFNIYGMRRAPEALNRAKQALVAGDIAQATLQVNDAADAWPGMEGIAALRRQLDNIKVEAGKVETEVTRLAKEKKYFAALPLLGRMGSVNAALANEVRSKTDAATRLVKQAATVTDVNKRIDMYMQALDLCADCVEAQTKLASVPPAPPAGINAEATGQSVKVQWSPVTSRFLHITVLRKQGAAPTSHDDGIVIARDVTSSTVTDTQVKPGVNYYYAVYSKCGDIKSALAVDPSPVMLAADIDPSQVSMVVSSTSVTVSCVLPDGAIGLNVQPRGGSSYFVNGNTFTESGLRPDTPVQYRVVTVFADAAGHRTLSPGVTLTLTATAPPQPVSLAVNDAEREARLSWGTPPAGQNVIIFWSQSEPFSQHLNDTVNVSTMKYKRLQVSGNSCTVNKDFAGTRYFLPVTVKGNLGVAGEPVKVRSVVAPEGVTFNRDGNRINVAWNWDRTERIVLVFTARGEQRVEFTRESCPDAKHSFVCPDSVESARVDVYNSVEGELSSPVSHTIVLRRMELEFKGVRQGGFLFMRNNKFTLTLSCKAPLPCNVKVYVGEGSVPLNLAIRTPIDEIKSNEVVVGADTEIALIYKPSKKVPLHFLLVPADPKAQMVITPASIEVK